MIARLITKLFTFILSLITKIVALILTPLTTTISALLPDLSTYVAKIVSFINTMLYMVGWFFNLLPPTTKSVILLYLSLLLVFFTAYAIYVVVEFSMYLITKIKNLFI